MTLVESYALYSKFVIDPKMPDIKSSRTSFEKASYDVRTQDRRLLITKRPLQETLDADLFILGAVNTVKIWGVGSPRDHQRDLRHHGGGLKTLHKSIFLKDLCIFGHKYN